MAAQPSVPDDEMVVAYLRRLAAHGAATKGIDAYRYGLRATLRAADRLAGRPMAMSDLFRHTTLLGRALVDDGGAVDGRQLSRWTLAQRRSAVRSFATLMRPELRLLLGVEPTQVVERALCDVAERVGTGYKLRGGTPRNRGGAAPDQEQLSALLDTLGRDHGFEGARNRSFFGILAATGARVNALRLLDGGDCILLPGGRLRLYLHEKGKHDLREVELGAAAADELHVYVDACGRWAAGNRWPNRVRLGEGGPVWRNAAGHRWGYEGVLRELRDGCREAGIPPCSPHALRRSFASIAASEMPRHVVALAGGWKGLQRLDDHYVQPHLAAILDKLAQSAHHADNTPERVHVLTAATLDV